MKTLDPQLYQIRKEAILEQARHLFATSGFAETTMDDIAQAIRIQKASLYHYFTSKQQILEEMIELEGQRWNAQIKDIAVDADFGQSLAHVGNAFLKNMDHPARREFFQIVHFESHKNPVIFNAFKESAAFRESAICSLFRRQLGERFTSKQIAMLATQFMGGLIHYATLSRLRGENTCPDTFTDLEFVEQMVTLFVHGMEKL
jgi:AcrR family transcriptional regulator